jgi:HNH endonuclease
LGEAKLRSAGIGVCIYCGELEGLSDEHIVPNGLGGNLVLRKSSCSACAKITGNLEQQLLRGHWWPQRLRAGLQSRTKHKEVEPLNVTVIRGDSSEFTAQLPRNEQTAFFELGFSRPSILSGRVSSGEPSAEFPTIRFLGPPPNSYILEGQRIVLRSEEQIRLPVDYSAIELSRFLAKVGHSYAISKRGLTYCREYFLPAIILGNTEGALTYIGNASSELLGARLPGNEFHALMERRNGDFLTVYVQLFRMIGDPPPIYEVVVGSLR